VADRNGGGRASAPGAAGWLIRGKGCLLRNVKGTFIGMQREHSFECPSRVKAGWNNININKTLIHKEFFFMFI
jgi:hypothetical protein